MIRPHVLACLVHEAPECILDLVDNLRFLDPDAAVLLYDGGTAGVCAGLRLGGRTGVAVHPSPRPLGWGRLHDFAVDCLRYAATELDAASLTVVDSDQLAIRPGYSRRLGSFLDAHPQAGCLASLPGVQPRSTLIGPAQAAWSEFEHWRPYLSRFPDGERRFPHWTFWPASVFTRAAADALVAMWGDDQLQAILGASALWASEEVLIPSLVALAGLEVVKNPFSYDYVQYRTRFSIPQIDAALSRPDAFWLHPVPRVYDDPIRARIRACFEGYLPAVPAPVAPLFERPGRPLDLTLPLLRNVQAAEGWLSAGEADLLAAAARRALGELPGPHILVEVGSYCGRATVVLGGVAAAAVPPATVVAIDPHDARLGTRDRNVPGLPDSLDRLRRNLASAGVQEVVEVVRAEALDVGWDRAISLLLIDHLHDFASVAADLAAFQPWVVDGGLVAFHDYGDDFPGVTALVDLLVRSGAYRPAGRAESLVVLEKAGTVALPDVPGTGDEEALLAIAAAHSATVAAAGGGTQMTVEPGGYLALQGYDEALPAARSFVAGLVRDGGFEALARVGSVLLLRRPGPAPAPPAVRSAFIALGEQPARGEAPAPGATASRPPRRTLVSCVMPTHNRRAFVPQAIRYFLRQDLTDSELIVVDDGTDPVADLIPDDPRIRYVGLPERHTIGQKRNIGCAQAWGEIIVHWDDDDWMASWRLRYQVDALMRQEVDQDVDVSGLRSLWFCHIPEGRAWRYEYPPDRQPWVADATFCYRRSLWERHPFADTSYGIDTGYLWQSPAKRVGVLDDPSFYVALVHEANTSRKDTADAWWHPCPAGDVASLMGDDWAFYEDVLRGTRPGAP